MPSLAALRQQLAALQPPPRAATATVPTGIAALDRLLSDGGLPCGRLTEILGRRGSGRTTLVRQLVTAAIEARRWVAVIDGSRTLSPRDWTAVGDSGRLWVVRPPAPDHGAWCADILLRSGAFSLVVLDGVPRIPRPVAIRLTRLAREQDVALVIAGEEGGLVGSAVRLRTHRSRVSGLARPASRVPHPDSRIPHPASEARITIAVEKGGMHHSVEVSCAIPMAHRLCAHPEVPDRRGVARRNRQGQRVASSHRRDPPAASERRNGRARDDGPRAAEQQAPGHHEERAPFVGGTLPRKRRFAEPVVKRDEFLLAR